MRNKNLEWWRFAFSILIISYHFLGHIYGVELKGYLAVEFFFVLSGFFIGKYIVETLNDKTPMNWLFARMKSLFPHYFLSFLLIFGLRLFVDHASVKTIINRVVTSVYELCFMQMTPLSYGAFNSPTWYISAMLIAGYLIVCICKKHRDSFMMLAPFIIIGIYGYLFINIGSLSITMEMTFIPLIRYGNLRALAAMTVGVVTYALFIKVRELKNIYIKNSVIVGNMILLFSLIASILIRFDALDFYIVPIFAVGILLVYEVKTSSGSINNICIWLGKLSYPLYLNHITLELIFKKFFCTVLPFKYAYPIYIVCNIVFAVITKKIVDTIMKFRTPNKKEMII